MISYNIFFELLQETNIWLVGASRIRVFGCATLETLVHWFVPDYKLVGRLLGNGGCCFMDLNPGRMMVRLDQTKDIKCMDCSVIE